MFTHEKDVKQWQKRPLEELYPTVYLDAPMVKVRDPAHNCRPCSGREHTQCQMLSHHS